MRAKDRRKHEKSKRELSRRLENRPHVRGRPMIQASNIHYEIAGRTEAIHCGGIGAIHLLAKQTGLIDKIDADLHLLKFHMPYHESDHVMTLAYNIFAGGQCIQDIDLMRNNPAFLNALDAVRIPDPTTAGDFLRRFTEPTVVTLMDSVNSIRPQIWRLQSAEFRRVGIIQMDGTLTPTEGECKKGMDISYNGVWGYAPLIVSLANTREPLFIVNRPGNTPSNADAATWIDKAISVVKPVFEEVWLRGDTDFALTKNFDGWTDGGTRFVFGYDCKETLVRRAEELTNYQPLDRPPGYKVKTEPREKRDRVKEEIVQKRGYENKVLEKEEIAEFDYRPTACKRDYRMVVVKKTIHVLKGQQRMWNETTYLFYITNDREKSAPDIVFFANDRGDHENDLEQFKNGVHALKAPTGDLVSNWAYSVCASLAWSLKSWMGLLTPQVETGFEIVRMEFRRFLATFINIPAQIVNTGRKLVYRFVGYMQQAPAFFDFVKRCGTLKLHSPLKL